MRKSFLIPIVLTFCSCVNKEPCNPGSPQQIQQLDGSNGGVVSSSHHIVVEGISLNCDSSTVMNIIKSYIETDTSNIPVSDIWIFKSKKHYDEGETLSQPKEYFDDEVMEVYFDEATHKPERFVFYDGGRKFYEGNRWKP